MRRMREGEPMINFTVGPVQSSEIVLSVGAEQVPYFRTEEFSKTMFENEQLIKKFAFADNAKVVFITGSGTASMEAAIINYFDSRDKLLVINGGSFGQRFVDLCQIHNIPFQQITLDVGENLLKEKLYEYDNKGFTGLLVNIHETSTGVHYDLDMLSEFCQKNHLFFVVDAISSFLADEIYFDQSKIDVMVTGSQKALACPPGISVMVLSPKAIKRLDDYPVKCMYLDLRSALKNAERGQTPFTPAVGILKQINARLKNIEANGGALKEIERVKFLAEDFRKKIKDLPFQISSTSMSNAVTPLRPKTKSAYEIFLMLKDEYGIWVCPNGGSLADKIFRVGHIGALTVEDNDLLIQALKDLQDRGEI